MTGRGASPVMAAVMALPSSGDVYRKL